MKRKINLVNNQRLDVPDALGLHDDVDTELRLLRTTALAEAVPQGLTAWTPTGVVLSGWTVAANGLDDQEVLVTPGAAICYQRLDDGTLSWGQVTASDPNVRAVVLGGAHAAKGIWARYVYVDAVAANRAKWRPDLNPQVEELFLANTRMVADVSLAYSTTAAPPAANEGWFKIADVDYTLGLVGAISDRRCMFFEGQAAGAANPATTWTLPEFDRGDSRATVGALALHGWAMRINKRIAELGGRLWQKAPTYGENVRSASSHLLIGPTTASAPHVVLGTTPTVAQLQALLLGLGASDARACLEFLPAGDYDVDCSAGAGTVLSTTHFSIGGSATLVRDVGINELIRTDALGVGYKATFRGLDFRNDVAGSPLIRFRNAGDEITFIDCTFGSVAEDASLIQIGDAAVAGSYRFLGCRFYSEIGSKTNLVEVGAGRVHFGACRFENATRGVLVLGDLARVTVDACSFNELDVGVEATDAVGYRYVTVTSPTFGTINAHEIKLGGGYPYTAGLAEGAASFGLEASAGVLRAIGGAVRFGTALKALTMGGGIFSGNDGAGDVPDLNFRNIWSTAGRFLFAGSPGVAGLRFEKNGVGPIAGPSPVPVVSLLHLASTEVGARGHFGDIQLGLKSDTRGMLPQYNAPKAVGLARAIRDGDGVNVLGTDGSGYRYDQGRLTVAYSAPAVGPNDAHRWIVTGLGLPDANYLVLAQIIASANEGELWGTMGITPALAGFAVTVYNQHADGFSMIPTFEEAGTRRNMMGNMAIVDHRTLTAYRIAFAVFAHSTAADFYA